jgi:hypothetical protein
MKAALNTRARIHLTRLTLGVAMATTLAFTALGGLTAHASPALHAPAAVISSPHITVDDADWGPLNPHVLPVAGFNFTVNSPVLIEVVNSDGAIVARASMIDWGDGTATSLHAGSFRYRLIIPAAFQLPGLRLFAIDEASRLRSNIIFFHYPIPNCIHHPYTCI